MNTADAAPPGTNTAAGIVSNELSALNCTARELKTSRLNWTVQMLTPNEINDVGLQLREDAPGGMKMLPAVAVIGIALPATEVPKALEILMAVPDAAVDTVTVRTATTPFCMMFAFRPSGPSPVRKQV